MKRLLTPEFRQSLLNHNQAEGNGQSLTPESVGPELMGNEVDELLAAQWAIVTRTLERVLGQTELYAAAVQELAHALQRNPLETAKPMADDEGKFPLPGLVYQSAAMRELARQIHKTRDSKLPALITGEPGTGKEGVARALHELSDRRKGPFVAFNCTIVTKELMSSQLFGHRKGSFTGADTNYQGSIRSAEGGTIFLDEIGDLPLDLQPKLLRFLQDGEVHPLGENKPVKVDVRVVTATNRDLEKMVAQGLFREDLYYRINILRYHMPPLRDRREEIPLLAFHLLERFTQDAGKGNLSFSPVALARLSSADWPGNIRQLSNQIQRAIALVDDGEVIQPHHLWAETTSEGRRNKRDWLDEILQGLPAPSAMPATPIETVPDLPSRERPSSATKQTLTQEVERLERELIVEALEKENFNMSKTAEGLGLSRRGLSLKIRRLRIDLKALRRATIQGAKLV